MANSSVVEDRHKSDLSFGLLGAHGGAGTTTVAAWLDADGITDTIELGLGSHVPPNYTPIVVARSTAFGMREAVHMIGRWHPQVPRPYLVVVRDAPLRLPRAVILRLTSVRPRLLGVVHVPYLARLRDADRPSQGLAHRSVQRAASQMRRDLGLHQ
ncbi:hypothetical protein OG275_38105 (plasmid) [Streptomyces niveus]|uniref:hypothetical protein n=1 Tax=Streptomyces niveus TaxID=193462 RepID=UPI002E33D86A|nr:hypothetical protein [Streptomyces niveus]